MFLWVDKILEEDAVTCDGRTSFSNDNEEWKMKISWKLGRLESEVRVLKMGGIFLFTCMLLLLVTVVVLVLKLDRQQSQLFCSYNCTCICCSVHIIALVILVEITAD